MNKPMNTLLIASVAALTGTASLSANAVDLYGGGAVGGSDYGDTGTLAEGTSVKSRDLGYKLFLGARITPNFAIEGGYTGLGKAKFNITLPDGKVTGSLNGSGIFIDALGTMPINSDWSFFGKVGVLHGKIKVSATMGDEGGSVSDTGTGARFGIGATYAVTKAISIRAEWERSRFSTSFDGEALKGNVDLISVGLTYNF